MSLVLTTIDESVAIVTLNRPDAMNSLTAELRVELLHTLRALASDPGIRAVVVTGSGRAFCAGQDLRQHVDEAMTSGDATLRNLTTEYNPIVELLATMPKPVIAALNGVAAGAGMGLALACDLRLMSSTASFVTAFGGIGLTLDAGVSWNLPRLVGRAKALELALLGTPVRAEAALALGLTTSVVEPDELLSAATDLARRLAAGPTAAFGAMKQSLTHADSSSLADALAEEAQLQRTAVESADHRNATHAFLAKEKPTFAGG